VLTLLKLAGLVVGRGRREAAAWDALRAGEGEL
jgi:hypothetical protein